jgi:hypothetical protein
MNKKNRLLITMIWLSGMLTITTASFAQPERKATAPVATLTYTNLETTNN